MSAASPPEVAAPGDGPPTVGTGDAGGTGQAAPRTRPLWRSVALPSEHGGWGLTLEPVVLGLLIAPSLAGAAVGVAAALAFLARTPLKIALVDRRRHRDLPRTRLARRVAAVEVGLVALVLVVASATATGPLWAPLLLAAPIVGVELWYDMRSRSRRLLPELAGTIAIGSVAAAIVLAADGTVATAAGAWLLVAARAVGSLPFVRYQLRRAKHRPHRRWAQDLAQLAAAALALGGAALGWLPWVAVAALGSLVTVQLVLARTPPPRAVVVGVQQLVLGLALVIIAGLSMTS